MTTDNDLINQFVELNPNRPGLDDARLSGFGVPVWAVVGYWLGYDGDVDRVAREYGVPREAVEAVLEYYRQHKSLIDARIQANAIAIAS